MMVSTVPVTIPSMGEAFGFDCDHSVFFAEKSGVAPSHSYFDAESPYRVPSHV